MALTDNLFAYWKLDESSGNAADATGNGRTLTNNGTVTYAAGKINNGAVFSNSASKYLENSAVDFKPGTNVFSIAGWFKATSDNDRIMSIVPSSFGTRQFIDIDIDTGNHIAVEIAWVSGGNQGHSAVSGAVTLYDGNFHHFVAVIDHNASKARITLYLDGVQVAQATHASLDYNLANSMRMIVGATKNWSSGAVEGPLNGTVDEVGYWIGKALTSTEVTQLYNGGAGLPYPLSIGPNNPGAFLPLLML